MGFNSMRASMTAVPEVSMCCNSVKLEHVVLQWSREFVIYRLGGWL